MKKSSTARQTVPPGVDRSPASKSSHVPLEKVKVDTANIPSPQSRKNSRDDKSALTKTLSKSHDNLASILRKKAAAATLAGNKENIKDRVLSPAPVTFKTPKAGAPIRKAQSTHDIDNSGTPIKRAQSAQNISKSSAGTNRDKNVSKATAVKRASSTQNVHKSPSRQRMPIPVNSMAHNAELLATFEKERRGYEAKISELIQCSESRKVELEKKKFVLKRYAEESRDIKQENRLYRDKLQELGVTLEHLTDADKLQLIHRRDDPHKTNCATGVDAHAGSTRASSVHRDGSEGDVLSQNLGCAGSERALSIGDVSCITPDHPSSLSFDNWDTKSNKSSDATSEISVACLQDRISQMEETHYSTNEELEATRLELADLQDTVNDLTYENETLSEDKSVLLESLCTQTEKLENCRLQIEHLKTLLVGDGHTRNWSLSEKQLVDLIKSGQQEKEELLLREKELCNQLHHVENTMREQQDEIVALRDASHIQSMKSESLASDKRVLDAQLSELKEQCAKDQIEMTRYHTLFDNERQRVTELEQERNATNRSDLEELLDSTRTEKDRLEEKLANTQEELAVSANEITKLRETIVSMDEELVVCKKNAKTEVSNLEYRVECVEQEKHQLQTEVDQLTEHIDQLQGDCDRYLEEKRTNEATIAQLQADLHAIQTTEQELDKKIRDEKQKYSQEKEDWEQFQMDLQLAVKVAADFKTEAQEDMERILAERHFYKHKKDELDNEVSHLQGEIEKYKNQQQSTDSDNKKRELRGNLMSTVDRELAVLRHGHKLSETRTTAAKENNSVKHLIATIEHQVKSDRNTPPVSPSITSQESICSRRNSTDSTISMGSMSEASPKMVLERRTSHPADTSFKSVLRRTPESKVSDSKSPIGHRHTISNIIMETDDSKKAASPTSNKPGTDAVDGGKKSLTGILSNKSTMRKGSLGSDAECKGDKSPYPYSGVQGLKTDPLAILAKQMGGSKRNALLKWCQHKLATYPGIDITNFSSSWNDGLAFCALLHMYLPDKIPYKQLSSQDKMRNFTLAFDAAKSVGITTHLNINDMAAIERPDWQAVMTYVTNIYKHFEIDSKS